MRTPQLADVLPVHPATGLKAIGFGRRGPIWPVMGGSQPTGEPTTPPAPPAPPTPPAQPPATGEGYPANTPVVEMTTEQQVAYWKAQSRKHEGRVGAMSDYAALKAKAEAHDALVAASATDAEKAIAAARTEAAAAAKAEVLGQVGGQLVEAHIRTAVGARLPEPQLTALLEHLDRSKFLGADHQVDADKVKTYVDSIAPAKPAGAPNLQQGTRGSTNTGGTATVAAGRDLWAERHPRKATS